MIVCTKFSPHLNGSLIGFADLFIPKWGIEIKGCALCQQNEKRWINLPAKEYKDSEGKKRYSAYVRFQKSCH